MTKAVSRDEFGKTRHDGQLLECLIHRGRVHSRDPVAVDDGHRLAADVSLFDIGRTLIDLAPTREVFRQAGKMIGRSC